MGDRLRAGIPSRYVTSQLGQLSLASLRNRLIEYQGGNITSVGWQVTLCDPIRHVSSRSGVATLRTAIHLLLTYFLGLHPWSEERRVAMLQRDNDSSIDTTRAALTSDLFSADTSL